ncbi:MAG: hypothetical protein RPR40_05850, partial [Bermanella sp.]
MARPLSFFSLAAAVNWLMVGVNSTEVVFGMDAKASPQGRVNGDLSAVNPSHGQAQGNRIKISTGVNLWNLPD